MEIGSVEAIRPIGRALPRRPDSALDGVFASEFRRQEHEPSRVPPSRASRGLEDESSDEPEGEAADGESGRSTVNLFA